VGFPKPVPGLVIRYAYLWHADFRKGQEEGVKDRPCAVILVTQDSDGVEIVTVLLVNETLLAQVPRDVHRIVQDAKDFDFAPFRADDAKYHEVPSVAPTARDVKAHQSFNAMLQRAHAMRVRAGPQ
jgi:hypothetical protein